MYGTSQRETSRQTSEDRQHVPYVVRDLSWELASYLETQDLPQSAFATANGAGGRPGWTRGEERLAG